MFYRYSIGLDRPDWIPLTLSRLVRLSRTFQRMLGTRRLPCHIVRPGSRLGRWSLCRLRPSSCWNYHFLDCRSMIWHWPEELAKAQTALQFGLRYDQDRPLRPSETPIKTL